MVRKLAAFLVLGVVTGVMALGAQTASSTTGGPVDSTPPDLQLSGPKKQDPQNVKGPICDNRLCDVFIHVSCGDEACTVRTWGRLTNVKIKKLGGGRLGGGSPSSSRRGRRPPFGAGAGE